VDRRRLSDDGVGERSARHSPTDDLPTDEERVSTGTFQKRVPHHAQVLDGSEDGEVVTFYDDGDGKS
jgi:hypothetical protein